MAHPAKQINEICHQIVNGEYDEAIASLTKTLKTLRLVLSGDAKIAVPKKEIGDENNDDRMDHSESLPSSSSEAYEYDFFLPLAPSSSFLKTVVAVNGRTTHDCSMCSEHHHKLRISIFRDPMMVRGDHLPVPLDVEVCEELSLVVIYNLALSHHLKSLELEVSNHPDHHHQQQQQQEQQQEEEARRRMYLQKALALYEHSHQMMLANERRQQNRIRFVAPFVHTMAILSNIGHIQHALGFHAKAEMCKEYLLSIIMYAIDRGTTKNLGNSLDGFFHIVRPLISGCAPAPAA